MSNNPDDPRHGKPDAKRDSLPQGARYDVGYGKPPKHTRFAKGQSGNLRGRPKKPKPQPLKLSDAPSDGFLAAEAYRSIALRENGQGIELPAIQAVLRAAVANAIKGNRLSQKYVLEYVARMEEHHFQIKMDHYRRLRDLKRDGERALAECEEQGLPPPDPLPHPEDIVLHPSTGEAFINGPETPEDVQVYEHTQQLRDYGLLLSANAEKTGKGLKLRHEGKTLCAYFFFAHLLDQSLPRRYHWREHEVVGLMMDYKGMTRRERERRIVAEFEQLNATKPRLSRITPEMDRKLDRIVDKFFKKRGD